MWIEEEGGRTGCIFVGSLFVKKKKKKKKKRNFQEFAGKFCDKVMTTFPFPHRIY